MFLQRQSFALFLKKGGKALPFLFLPRQSITCRKKIVVTLTQYLVCVVVVVSQLLPQRRDVASFFSSSKKLCSDRLLLSSAVFLRRLLRHFLHFFSSMILLLFQTLFLQRQSFALFLKEGQSSAFFYFAEITWPLHVGFSKDNTTTTMSIAMPC